MQLDVNESVIAVPMPWQNSDGFARSLGGQLPFEAALAAVFGDRQQQADELLIASGWPPSTLGGWLASGLHRDPFVSRARRRGVVQTRTSLLGSEHVLRRHPYALAATLPVAGSTRRWWCLVLSRNGLAFTRREQAIAALMLRSWQAAFDCSTEPDMGRLMIGHDDRLIHADPLTELRILKNPSMLEQFSALLHPVVQQRWPDLSDGDKHDFVVDLSGQRCWITFSRNRSVQTVDSEHWYVELRALSEGDLPAVGAVEDQRVARSLAYLHDCYAQTPSLTQVARQAGVSPFYFHRLFSKLVGISPKHYLQGKQLQMAKWFLTSSRQPIGSIARLTGFASHGHFTSTFHRLVGVSPSQYRER